MDRTSPVEGKGRMRLANELNVKIFAQMSEVRVFKIHKRILDNGLCSSSKIINDIRGDFWSHGKNIVLCTL